MKEIKVGEDRQDGIREDFLMVTFPHKQPNCGEVGEEEEPGSLAEELAGDCLRGWERNSEGFGVSGQKKGGRKRYGVGTDKAKG